MVGNLISAGLPNITGSFTNVAIMGTSVDTGAIKKNTTATLSYFGSGSATVTGGFTFDASDSNSIYSNSNTVQPLTTQMYLEFYIN